MQYTLKVGRDVAGDQNFSIMNSPDESCQVLDGFALFVQLLLALIAFSSLIIKRNRENPRRPFKVWAFDVSKQALGGILLHSGNLFGAVTGGGNKPTNPCVW